MKIAEYNNIKKHIFEHMAVEDLAENIKACKNRREIATTWHAAHQMAQDGFFNCYYSQVLETLKDIYGKDYKEETYKTKDGSLRWKNDEPYCWTVYKAKIASAVEQMERKGEL